MPRTPVTRANSGAPPQRHRVVVIGGGFGGLQAAKHLATAPVDLTMVDRRNFGAGGSPYSYFGHDECRRYAPEVKSLESALTTRARIVGAFEAAETEPYPDTRPALLTFVIVGAGSTGVEIDEEAGSVAALDGSTERIPARTAIWAAGVKASAVAAQLGEASGAEIDRADRVAVEPDLTLRGHPEVPALGDMVRVRGPGNLATIGRARAVADLHAIQLRRPDPLVHQLRHQRPGRAADHEHARHRFGSRCRDSWTDANTVNRRLERADGPAAVRPPQSSAIPIPPKAQVR